jgi:hypothetical protein
MSTIDDMAIALRFAKSMMPSTPHGEIIKRRIAYAIAAYEREKPRLNKSIKSDACFKNRLMQ